VTGPGFKAIDTLASISNYENISTGTHVQLGITYPEEFTRNVDRRRSSHKAAERARRDRINGAIDRLGLLLGGSEGTGVTKLEIVEEAIVCIKQLREQLKEAQATIEEIRNSKNSI
jgi:hypothetical protein